MKITKEEFQNKLVNSSIMSSSFQKLTEKQYDDLKEYANTLSNKIADVFVPLINKMHSDEEFAKTFQNELQKEAINPDRVIIDTSVSGSK